MERWPLVANRLVNYGSWRVQVQTRLADPDHHPVAFASRIDHRNIGKALPARSPFDIAAMRLAKATG